MQFIDGDNLSMYALRQMSQERIDLIALNWKMTAGSEEFAIEIAEVFESAKSHLSHRQGFGHYLELFEVESNDAHALLEVIDSPNAALTKLLKIWISPKFWGLDGSSESIHSLSRVYSGAYAGLIESGFDKGFKDVKIYGRNNFMLEVLTYLSNNWDESDQSTSAKMEGRWLRVSLNKVG